MPRAFLTATGHLARHFKKAGHYLGGSLNPGVFIRKKGILDKHNMPTEKYAKKKYFKIDSVVIGRRREVYPTLRVCDDGLKLIERVVRKAYKIAEPQPQPVKKNRVGEWTIIDKPYNIFFKICLGEDSHEKENDQEARFKKDTEIQVNECHKSCKKKKAEEKTLQRMQKHS
jgi:hypothetical protein